MSIHGYIWLHTTEIFECIQYINIYIYAQVYTYMNIYTHEYVFA